MTFWLQISTIICVFMGSMLSLSVKKYKWPKFYFFNFSSCDFWPVPSTPRVRPWSLDSLSRRSTRVSSDPTLSAPITRAQWRPARCHRRYTTLRCSPSTLRTTARSLTHPSPLSPPAADPWPFGQPAALRPHLGLHLAIPLQQPIIWCPAAALPQGGHARQPRQHGGGQPPPGRRWLPLGRLQYLGCRTLPIRDGRSVGDWPQGSPGWPRPQRATTLWSRRPPSQRGGWQSHTHQHPEAPACLRRRPARRRHRCWVPFGGGVALGGSSRSLPVSVTHTTAVEFALTEKMEYVSVEAACVPFTALRGRWIAETLDWLLQTKESESCPWLHQRCTIICLRAWQCCVLAADTIQIQIEYYNSWLKKMLKATPLSCIHTKRDNDFICRMMN